MHIKDISSIEGVRDNQLLGYGLVVGLQNTGDTLLNSTFTQQALQSMLDRMGINVRGTGMRTRNVAAVLVTADVPPFVTPGTRVDVTVSSLGDATSLMGGTLVLTSLNGVDGRPMRSPRAGRGLRLFGRGAGRKHHRKCTDCGPKSPMARSWSVQYLAIWRTSARSLLN